MSGIAFTVETVMQLFFFFFFLNVGGEEVTANLCLGYNQGAWHKEGRKIVLVVGTLEDSPLREQRVLPIPLIY